MTCSPTAHRVDLSSPSCVRWGRLAVLAFHRTRHGTELWSMTYKLVGPGYVFLLFSFILFFALLPFFLKTKIIAAVVLPLADVLRNSCLAEVLFVLSVFIAWFADECYDPLFISLVLILCTLDHGLIACFFGLSLTPGRVC